MNNARLDDAVRELKSFEWSKESLELGVRQDFKCCYCNRDLVNTIEDFDVWNFDHVVPLTKGGAGGVENIVVACKLCNYVKGTFDPRSKAREGATLEELTAISAEYVKEGRKEKKARLDKFREVLRRTGLVSPERLKN